MVALFSSDPDADPVSRACVRVCASVLEPACECECAFATATAAGWLAEWLAGWLVGLNIIIHGDFLFFPVPIPKNKGMQYSSSATKNEYRMNWDNK